MRLAERMNPVYPIQNRKHIENFIDQSLLGSWVIRVEHLNNSARDKAAWQAWGNTLFAIASPDVVMDAIDTCHASYPDNEIRIYAENMRPEMRMVYTVFR